VLFSLQTVFLAEKLYSLDVLAQGSQPEGNSPPGGNFVFARGDFIFRILFIM